MFATHCESDPLIIRRSLLQRPGGDARIVRRSFASDCLMRMTDYEFMAPRTTEIWQNGQPHLLINKSQQIVVAKRTRHLQSDRHA